MYSPPNFNLELTRRFMRWMEIQHYARGTKHQYQTILSAFRESLGEKLATHATHDDVLEFLTSEATRGRSLQSLHNRLDSLRVFYDFLKLGGMEHLSPARLIRLRHVQRKIPRILSEDDVRRLIAHSQTRRDRVLLELLYCTGCRLGEVAAIKVENIDFNARTICVVGKTGTRIVLFGEEAKKAILAYVGNRREGFLFKTDYPTQRGSLYPSGKSWIGKWMDYGRENGKPRVIQRIVGRTDLMTYSEAKNRFSEMICQGHPTRRERESPPRTQTLQASVSKAALRAGLGNVTPRTLRHTFATHLLNHGASTRVIQELMGHAWLQSTEIYTHVSKQNIADTFRSCHPRGA